MTQKKHFQTVNVHYLLKIKRCFKIPFPVFSRGRCTVAADICMWCLSLEKYLIAGLYSATNLVIHVTIFFTQTSAVTPCDQHFEEKNVAATLKVSIS